jgi:DNA-binding transcriptional MerR regulator
MMNPDTSYTIQQISAETDLPGSTLRYYEEIGLLDPIPRAANGHRRYRQTDLHRVILIKRLRLTGMSIERMIEFVALYRGGNSTARQRREMVQARVDELLEMMGFIDYKIGLYEDEEAEYEREQEYEIPFVG